MKIKMMSVDLKDRAEVKKLNALDLEIFGKADAADSASYWKGSFAYWIMLGGEVAGSVAFWSNMRFTDGESWEKSPGWVYFGTLGVLPRFRGRGIEGFVEEWEVQEARNKGFLKFSTNERESDTDALAVHQKVGFKVIRTEGGYWEDPDEPNVVLELEFAQ